MDAFCCHGCRTVHTILLAKNELENFVEHPLFKQALQSGLISNPDLMDRHKPAAEEQRKIYFEINDLWCPSCAEVIRLVLLQSPAIFRCTVDYATDLASVEFSPRQISKESVFQLVRSLGYTPVENEERVAVSRSLYLRFILAAFCALNVMMFAYPLYATYFDYDPLEYGLLFAWLSCAMSLPAVTYCAWPIFRRFYNGLKVGLWGMEALVVAGVSSAFIFSLYELLNHRTQVYFDSMTVIIAFVLLGKILESRAKFSAKHALLRLSRSVPKRGRKRFSDGTERFVPIKEILPGDTIMVIAGEKIVLDGVVVEGEGYCDEALMTGESTPIKKVQGSFVIGGSILQQGRLLFQATASAEESLLRRIIDMVEQDMGHKSAYTRAVDPLLRWFVPCVLLLATGAGLYSGTLLRSLSVLLISCPCAIGIAAPLAESYLMNALASLGVLIRNRGCLADLGRETHYVFDKTGTITEGVFTFLSGLENLSAQQLQVLKSMCVQSNHLIAAALSHAIQEEKMALETTEVIGKGLQAVHGTDFYYLGSRLFLEENGVSIPDHETEHTTVYFAKNRQLLSVILLGDRIRPEALALRDQLPVEMTLLSGDGPGVVETVAKACRFDSFLFGQTPTQKRLYIEGLKKSGAIVCVVGDGMNDAPSLASAHVGISVASATDISIQASDILLTTHKLSILQTMRILASKGRAIIRQNLFWAFFYNIIGIGLALTGLLTPIFSTFAMMISSLIVLINARRLTQ